MNMRVDGVCYSWSDKITNTHLGLFITYVANNLSYLPTLSRLCDIDAGIR
jgi:hypothetical protein